MKCSCGNEIGAERESLGLMGFSVGLGIIGIFGPTVYWSFMIFLIEIGGLIVGLLCMTA